MNLPTPPIHYHRYKDNTIPLQFTMSEEINGSLFVGTGDGVWKLDATLSWTELPKFPRMKWTSNNYDVYDVAGLVKYKDKLVAIDGFHSRVYQWDEGGTWIELDSLITPPYITVNGDSSYRIYRNSFLFMKDVATDGKHLFLAGSNPSSCPKVYMGDYGEPYGNIVKGWRSINLDWCNAYNGCATRETTRSLDVIGDTLYAAAWDGLYKFPLAELDYAIADQPDYRSVDKYQ